MGCAASCSTCVDHKGIDFLENEKAGRAPILQPNTPISAQAVNGTPLSHKGSVMDGTVVTDSVCGVPVDKWPQRLLADAPAHPWMIYRILEFLPMSQRGCTMLQISARLRQFFNPSDAHGSYWHFMCHSFASEALLYLPSSEKDVQLIAGGDGRDEDGDYRTLFKDLWKLRHRFAKEAQADEADANSENPESFRVSTFCRVRPVKKVALDGLEAAEMLTSTPVQLPLSQRIALLQQKNPKLTRGEAMKQLMNKQMGSAKPLPEGDCLTQEAPDDETKADAENVDPLADSTAKGFSAKVLSVTSGPFGSVLTMSPGIGIRNWEFANVFDSSSNQRGVYERCGLRLATGLVNGQSGALIVYGQTGSGKTHTMFGPSSGADGLVPHIAEDVLKAIELRKNDGFEIFFGASYVEVFGNDITDLLGKEIGAHRGQAQRMGHKYVLEGQCEEPVANAEAFGSLLARGEAAKRKASTQMNERSTRAHTLVILRLRQRAPNQERFVESLLSLVDLGGSEKVSKSKANENACAPGAVMVGDEEVSRVSWAEYYKSRERITETNHINKGLLTLKRCVQALNERQGCAEDGREPPRVPFKDSRLTMLLQPALCGEAATSVVVCCAPEEQHAEETVQSLRFGEMCGSVEQNRVGKTQDASAAVAEALRKIDSEIKDLEGRIRQKEKWEWRQVTRTDVIDQMDTGGALVNKEEIMELGGAGAIDLGADDGKSKKLETEHKVWGQVLVGAEEENARRDELIKMRMRLLGDDE
eukprot:TRINITY_DN3782_c3_g1_i1.p1 TRINITY_DN3782_c3_g1~~TRINITY_DN3782_c3_g1_i1.p1  ORF type:complete len:758 (-),score=176.80 TRINITY_DN3782_c3_g1_i1:76-2349(-)